MNTYEDARDRIGRALTALMELGLPYDRYTVVMHPDYLAAVLMDVPSFYVTDVTEDSIFGLPLKADLHLRGDLALRHEVPA